MGIRLNRTGIFVLGALIIYTYYLYNRLKIVFNSTETTGVIVSADEAGPAWYAHLGKNKCARFIHPEFGVLYAPNNDEGLKYGDTITVLYNTKVPSIAYIYTFRGFWLIGLLYSIIPIMLWIAFALGYVHQKKTIRIKVPSLKGNLKIIKLRWPWSRLQ